MIEMSTESSISTLMLKEKAVSFLQAVASGKVREAYESYVGPDFRHHNPYYRGDRDSLMKAMEENQVESPNKVLEVKLAIQEEDKVTTYSHIKQNPDDLGAAVVHIFRFQDGKIVEMWDTGQAIPEDSPNENGMF
jgi:predicted SnoaL-like aldol condensation-catalyzing enzyme